MPAAIRTRRRCRFGYSVANGGGFNNSVGHILAYLDGRDVHIANDLQVPSNVKLIKLPPYSSEFNGIENLWRYLRSHFWANRVYLDYDDLFEVAESTWRKNCLNRELIASVCAKNYIQTRSWLLGSE